MQAVEPSRAEQERQPDEARHQKHSEDGAEAEDGKIEQTEGG